MSPSPSATTAPFFNSLALQIGETINVIGSATIPRGEVQVFADELWKGIGNIGDGLFQNDKLPHSYLLTPTSVLVRLVDEQGNASTPVLANDRFVHARSFVIAPTKTKQDDQTFHRWRLQWADYQPTGYRLPPGVLATLELEGDDSAVIATIGIQGLAERNDRSQQTPNMREVRLRKGTNVLPADELGGVLHIRNNGSAACRLVLDELFEPIPYFHYRYTHPDDFAAMLAASAEKTEVQLVGERVSICAYADTFRAFAAPDVIEIVRAHEEVLQLEAEASGLDGSSPVQTRSNMWIHAVEGASTINPQATTGLIMLPHSMNPHNEFMRGLLGGEARNRWGILHEYGHHFQNQVNAIPPFDEISVNIYTLAVGRVHKNEYSDVLPQRWPALRAWLKKPQDEKSYHESPDPLAIFGQLRKGISEDLLTRWDRHIRDSPGISTDLVGFTTSLCTVAQCSLAEFFADWGVVKVGDKAWQAMQVLGLPAAPAGLITHAPYE